MPVRMDQNYWRIAESTQRIASFIWAACAVLLISATPAQAAAVSYFLDQSNRLPDGIDYLKVTLDDEGAVGAINFKIEALTPLSDLSCYKFGIQKFGFNGMELDKSNISGLPDGWRIRHDKEMDDFDKYENVLVGKPWNRQDPLTFSIVGIDGDNLSSYATSHDGDDGLFFAARVGGFSPKEKDWGCRSCARGAYFAGGDVAPVPVPAALWLFGSGLVGLLGLASRRNRNTQ